MEQGADEILGESRKRHEEPIRLTVVVKLAIKQNKFWHSNRSENDKSKNSKCGRLLTRKTLSCKREMSRGGKCDWRNPMD